MTANRQGDDLVITLTADEAHVLIWGGPSDLFDAMNGQLRTTLVGVEDSAFTDAEYRARFGDLDALYARLRNSPDEAGVQK